MAADIEVIQRTSQPALAIKAEAPSFKLPMIMGKSYGRIMAYMQAKGIEMNGAPYTLYQGIDWQQAGQASGLKAFIAMFTQKWKMEIGVPVATDTAGEGELASFHLGEVLVTTIPAGRYLKTLHRGPYAKVGEAYNRLMAYASEQGLKLAPYSLEMYLNDPETVSKQALETEVLIALLD